MPSRAATLSLPLLPARSHAVENLALPISDIVTRSGHRILATGELQLKHHLVECTKRDLTDREIEFPHTTEALIVERLDLIPVLSEAPRPFLQRIRIVEL